MSRPSVTLSKRQQLKAFKGVTLHRDISNPPREIEVSRPSVMLQQTVTVHRDTSIRLGGSEESRQVCSSLVHPLALNLETTTLALEGRHVTASTVRSAARLYDWLNDRDVLIGKADRQEPSVVLRLSLAAEIAKGTAEMVEIAKATPGATEIAKAATLIRSEATPRGVRHDHR